MKRLFILLLLLSLSSCGEDSSQILRGFVVPDGAQDFESASKSAGVVMPSGLYDMCLNSESYIWTNLAADTANELVSNLDRQIRQTPWEILASETEDNTTIHIGQQDGTALAVAVITGGKESEHHVTLLLCKVRTN